MSDLKETIATLAEFFFSNCPKLTKGVKGRKAASLIAGENLRKAENPFAVCYRALAAEDKTKLRGSLNPETLSYFEELLAGDYRLEFLDALEKTVPKGFSTEGPAGEEGEEVTPNLTETYFNDGMTTPLSEFKLVINLNDRKKSFLYDQLKDIVHDYDYDVTISRLKDLLGPGFKPWFASNVIYCTPEYRPNKTPRVSVDNENQRNLFNTWLEAPWRVKWEPKPGEACPGEIEAFFDSFVLNGDDRRSMLAWLRDATFERAEPILVLCGKPGTGKNFFVEHLAGSLVGKNNYRSASRGFNNSQFHSNVSHCRLFFLDEMPLSAAARETLKSYHNGVASIERKGKDVGSPEKIYASFALANNHEMEVKLQYTDRKFYVPIVSSVPLTQSIPQFKVDYLRKLLETDFDFCRQLASYLYFNYEPGESQKFKKNEYFKRLCLNALPTYFRRFLHMLSKKEEFNHKDFSKGVKNNIDTFALASEIEKYEAQFGEKLADFTVTDNGLWEVKSYIKDKLVIDNPDRRKANGAHPGDGFAL